MIACFDVHYNDQDANAAVILFEQWTDERPADQLVVRCQNVGDYQAGSFYQRELGPLQAVIEQITVPVEAFVIDAYCHLSEDLAPGLGDYLYQSLPEDSVVIGVAKNRFRSTEHAVQVIRGDSKRTLFVSSIGIEYQAAAKLIQSMAGHHREPTLLKAVDRLCRDAKFI